MSNFDVFTSDVTTIVTNNYTVQVNSDLDGDSIPLHEIFNINTEMLENNTELMLDEGTYEVQLMCVIKKVKP